MTKQIPAWVSVALLLIQFTAGFVGYGKLQGRIDALEFEVHIVLENEIRHDSKKPGEMFPRSSGSVVADCRAICLSAPCAHLPAYSLSGFYGQDACRSVRFSDRLPETSAACLPLFAD